jgi:pantoate kinase
MPDHERFMITSTKFASESQLIKLARTQGKILFKTITAQELRVTGENIKATEEGEKEKQWVQALHDDYSVCPIQT